MAEDADVLCDGEQQNSVGVPIAEWPYPWSVDDDMARRTFIFTYMADANIVGATLVENMAIIDEWIRTGVVPQKAAKRNLKVV